MIDEDICFDIRSTSLFDKEEPYNHINSVNNTPIIEMGTVHLLVFLALSNDF